MSFGLGFDAEGQMDRHLVTVKVGVETPAGERMKHNCIAFDEHRLEGLDTHSMKSRSAVEQDGMLMDDLFEDIPDLFVPAFNHSLCAFYGVCKAVLL
jgi:hypothetical protein